MQVAELAKLPGTVRARRDMGLHVMGMAGIELIVDERVQQHFGFVAGHFGCPSAASQASRSMERARARRDITVPTGAPTTSAISRYDRSLISRSTITSRNTSGSAATKPLIVSASNLPSTAASGVSCGSTHMGAGGSDLSDSAWMSRNSTTERRAYSALQTLRRIASSHGLVVGLRIVSKWRSARR